MPIHAAPLASGNVDAIDDSDLLDIMMFMHSPPPRGIIIIIILVVGTVVVAILVDWRTNGSHR
jgi:hypothetical protein